jgi:predicted nuclease of restriction endonuclease-like (RecB) superfamily
LAFLAIRDFNLALIAEHALVIVSYELEFSNRLWKAATLLFRYISIGGIYVSTSRLRIGVAL